MEDAPEFDPYQVFTVTHPVCKILTVTVLCGRNISKGWEDYVDEPDPYVQLRVPNAPDGVRQTKVFTNEVNPVWNETFTFLLDPLNENILQLTLWESNYMMDTVIGTTTFDLNSLPCVKKTTETFFLNQTSEIDVEFQIEYDNNPSLRYSLCLHPSEKKFKETRRTKCMKAMQKLLGSKGPTNTRQTPTIGILGSGGGFRAMVAMSGVIKALKESGVLDCAMYMSGLSGSSWCISTLYSHPDWPNLDIADFQDEMKNNIDSSLFYLLSPQSIYRYIDSIVSKRKNGQPVSFTDFFGHLVGETLLRGRMDSKLSHQQAKINDGDAPCPLYTCVHVKKDVSAQVFHEWVEFSPYEIGMPKYGTFLDSHLFGSKFFLGKLCRQFPEPPLFFLQGIWGSAFCILFKRLTDNNKKIDPVEMVREEMEKQLQEEETDEESDLSEDEGNQQNKTDKQKQPRETGSSSGGFWKDFLQGIFNSNSLLNSRSGRAGVIHNFMRGLSLNKSYSLTPFINALQEDNEDTFDGIFDMASTQQKKLFVVDAGLTFNSPYPLLLRPQRGVNLLLSFDFSARPSDDHHPFKELLLAEKWAKLNKLPFPPIDTCVFDREGIKELYIFRHPTDPHCPIVMHFVLLNKTFREYKSPGVKRETQEEKDFADFSIFDDPNTPYSTFNFTYPHRAFEQLSKLAEFNTLLHIDDIKQCMAELVEKRVQSPPNILFSLSSLKMIEMRNRRMRERMGKMLQNVRDRKKSAATDSKNDDDDEDSDVFYEAASEILSGHSPTKSHVSVNSTTAGNGRRKTDYYSTSSEI
ncbi:cytosolic phospholipase A2-like isoform X2 [Tubulanus polymorphus]